MRILLVDDDTAVVQAMLGILKTLPGHEVRVATNGAKALENAATMGGVDLLITDVVMDPMDGFTLRDHMVSQYPDVRTILISGYDLSDYPAQTKNHQLLQKPVETEVLFAAIAKEMAVIPQAEPARPARAIPVQQPIEDPQDWVDQPTMRIELPPPSVAPKQPTARPAATPQQPQQPRPAAAPVAPATVRVSGTTRVPPVGQPVARPTAAPVAQPAARPAAQPTAAPAAVRTVKATAVPPPAVAVPKAAPAAPKAAAVPKPNPPAPAYVEVDEESGAAAPVSFNSTPVAADDLGELAGQPFGAYLLDRKIAHGRWGSVYFGVQLSINRPVGIEILDADKAGDEDIRERFIADARAKAQVQHPSIVAVYEAGEADGRYFYAHEYVDGGTLADLKAAGDKLDEITALKALRVVSEGLAYLASHHIPHHPPDAASIFIGKNGQAHLSNVATHTAENPRTAEQEIQAVGRIMLSVLPAIQTVAVGLRDLLKAMVQTGPEQLTTWGKVLQGIKAIEPKVIPMEAAKISAQDRAAIAAVEQARKQQKRALYFSIGSVGSLLILVGAIAYYVMGSNERSLDEQVQIPAGEFLFAHGESKTLPDFWIDKYEVTLGQYAKFVKALEDHPTSEYDHPQQPRIKTATMHKPEHWEIYYKNAAQGRSAHSTPIDLNCPAMEVDFWDAYAYAKWKGRELPTEEEWEKAARGTKGFTYPWGEDFDPKKVNSGADFNPGKPDAKGATDGFNFWNPVDKVKGDKSPFGVIGMAGNVSEWTNTWEKQKVILKGGSFASKEVNLDKRAVMDPSKVDESIGFRTVSHTLPAPKK
ncbi:MAG TPA: SUMF1/EgtB/PvdO family nonheme iron enzyme [Chthoniobacter sp.]|nr:SUMF1/EgtB/PvdO family nonheme iron enzyme [Chthoniobacter sp.]